MALTVNTNIASLTAQRNLTGSQNMLSTSLERLSSGLRINSAKDDAAGLAISERFNAQIRGLNQGVRNANDGISLAQTAEGALKEVTSNLQRIRELAVQSVNATNSDSDRAALQAEVSQLVAEIDRVAVNTKFNGNALLNGDFSSKAFQVGSNVGETVTITSIQSTRTSALGSTQSADTSGETLKAVTVGDGSYDGVSTSAIDGSVAATSVYINGTKITDTVADGVSSTSDTSSAYAKAAAINAATSTTGVTAVATTSMTFANDTDNDVDLEDGDLKINGVNVGAITLTGAADATAAAALVVEAINDKTSQTGVVASNAAGRITLTASDGRNIQIEATDADAGEDISDLLEALGLQDTVGGNAGTDTALDQVFRGSLSLSSNSATGIQITQDGSTTGDATAAAAAALLGFNAEVAVSATGTGTALSVASVATVDSANLVIASVDNALATVNSIRADLGSYQNRFESVVANLQTTAENLSASRSRIVDADFASETANLTKAQILQQSGIAMLAQANSIPQNVLALLQ